MRILLHHSTHPALSTHIHLIGGICASTCLSSAAHADDHDMALITQPLMSLMIAVPTIDWLLLAYGEFNKG